MLRQRDPYLASWCASSTEDIGVANFALGGLDGAEMAPKLGKALRWTVQNRVIC